MSVQAMTWALEQQLVKDPTARHVLLCLANYADPYGGSAFPSAATLATDTGLSERSVRLKLQQLQAVGVIRPGNQAIAAAHIQRGDRRPVVYYLCITGVQPVHPVAKTPPTGCSSRPNGVQLTTERGAGAAPEPSLTVIGTKTPAPVAPSSGLPLWIKPEAWAAFDAMRRKIRAPMTVEAADLTISELTKFKAAGEDPNAILDKSVQMSWRGVFSLKPKPQASNYGRTEPVNVAPKAKTSAEIHAKYGPNATPARPEVVAKHVADLKKRLHIRD